jgi:hypothetical protein
MSSYPITVRGGDRMTEHSYPSAVTLTWYEVSVAIHLVGLRHTESLRKNMKDKHGYKGRDLQDNFYGMLGELALAKATNKYFPMTVNTFKEADIGNNWQVRTVGSNKNRDLIVRPADPTKHKYILVEITKEFEMGYRNLTPHSTNDYQATVHGWIEGMNAKDPKYLSDFGHPDRPKAYRIPKKDLRPTSWMPI